MPVRIRKSFNLFPGVKVNMSKGGMSITVGRKGFHLNFSKRGVKQLLFSYLLWRCILGLLPPSNLITQFPQLLTQWAQQADL